MISSVGIFIKIFIKILCFEKNYPGKRPQTVWGGAEGYCTIGRDDNNDEDEEEVDADDDDDDDDEGGDGEDDADDEDEEEDDDVEEEDVEEENRSQDRKHTLCEPAQSKCTWTFHVWKFKGNWPDPNPGDIVLCEPAQSKRTWTFQKSHFAWKFTGNWPDADGTTSIKHRALTLTARIPSVWPHCLANNDNIK